jgi:LPXTG-motif cell wall-anchored protein
MNLNTVLKDLPPFTGRKDILIYNQDVEDIIKGILKASDSYAGHYRKIWPYFEGGGYRSTARNVWNFLKSNSDYVIEPDSRQTIKTPAAILATAKKSYGGNDCKNFALFSAGVLKAYRDATGEDFNLYFRFAGYNGGGLSHVFTVIEKNGAEIWVDPVLDTFNDRTHEPTKIKDFKINKMALIALSGINPYENDKSAFQNSNPVPGQYLGRVKIEDVSSFVKSTGLPFAQTAGQLIDTLTSLFGQKDVPGNYWMAWESIDQQYGNPIGASAQHWIVFDGDSIQNEALNIVAYIRNSDPTLEKILSQNSTTLRDFGRYVTFEDLINKLNRGGFSNEAEQLKNVYKNLTKKPDTGSTKAGTNMLVTIALIGAAAFFLLKKR